MLTTVPVTCVTASLLSAIASVQIYGTTLKVP